MKKSKVLLIGVASVCMGLLVREVMKNSVQEAEELADRVVKQIKPVEKSTHIVEFPVATKPCQNERMIDFQKNNSAKEFIERRKKRIMMKKYKNLYSKK